MQKLRVFSPVILRIGIALVFLWFGANQLSDVNSWIGYIPSWITDISGLSAQTIVYMNGTFEIIFGTALLFGFYTRFVAFFLMLHMIDITFTVGLDQIGVRDFGLSIAMIAIWLNGSDFFTLDRFMKS
jgi:uncharacterized membrane protein YphA (DoxX/SURF4 family)